MPISTTWKHWTSQLARLAFVPCVLVALFSVSLTSAQESAAKKSSGKQPNVILIMADDLGWGDVGFNGNRVIKTPHLDELAAAGMRFERFYSAAPVCSPTRGSCLTGRHPFRYGIVNANAGHIRKGEVTLAELLKDHGYTTGHFGKWHLGTLTKELRESNRGGPKGAAHFAPPSEHGFDANFSTEAKVPTWDPMLRPLAAKGNIWWDPVEDAADAKPYNTHYWSRGKLVEDNLRGDDSRVIMDRAIPFVRQAAKARQPFFAVIWFHTPHLPVVAGPKYTAMYKKHDKHSQHYFGCITAMDEQIGRLWHELEELGVRNDTLITFCSDNGPEGNDSSPGSAGGLRGRKRSLYEGGVRVPGCIVWPAKIKAGSETAIPACTSDYLPTVAAIVGARMDEQRPLDGVDLLPLLAGEMQQRPRPIGFQSAGQLSLVDNRWKLIRNRGRKRSGDYELYDLIADRGESNDLAGENQEIVQQMAKTVEAWQKSCQQSATGADYE